MDVKRIESMNAGPNAGPNAEPSTARIVVVQLLMTLGLLVGVGVPISAQDQDTHTAVAQAPQTPAVLIDDFHQQLLGLMQSSAAFAQREQTIAKVIPKVFDLTSIARVSLGRATWKSLDAQAREQFVALLGELVAATYASRFDSFNDQRFELRETTSPRPGRHVVKTELIRSTGERVNLDYYLNKNRVFNVVADGVSDLSLRRADYSAVIKQSGYPALVSQIEASIAAYRAGD